MDGVFLDESPNDMLDRGDFKQSPVIAGFNKDEGTLFYPYFYPRYIGEEDPPYISRERFDFVSTGLPVETFLTLFFFVSEFVRQFFFKHPFRLFHKNEAFTEITCCFILHSNVLQHLEP